jgi:hypothetical protein
LATSLGTDFQNQGEVPAIILPKANATIAEIEGYNATRRKISDAITDHHFSYWQQRSLDKKNNLFEKREIGGPK